MWCWAEEMEMSMACVLVFLTVMGACLLKKYAFIIHEGYSAVKTIVDPFWSVGFLQEVVRDGSVTCDGDHRDVTVYRALAFSETKNSARSLVIGQNPQASSGIQKISAVLLGVLLWILYIGRARHPDPGSPPGPPRISIEFSKCGRLAG